MKTGIELIAEERQRQIDKEKWTPEHDDSHSKGEIALAAACYAAGKEHTHVPHMLNSARGMDDAGYVYEYAEQDYDQIEWPWSGDDYKPGTDRIRELTKAGALIAAEIDRLQRTKKGPQ